MHKSFHKMCDSLSHSISRSLAVNVSPSPHQQCNKFHMVFPFTVQSAAWCKKSPNLEEIWKWSNALYLPTHIHMSLCSLSLFTFFPPLLLSLHSPLLSSCQLGFSFCLFSLLPLCNPLSFPLFPLLLFLIVSSFLFIPWFLLSLHFPIQTSWGFLVLLTSANHSCLEGAFSGVRPSLQWPYKVTGECMAWQSICFIRERHTQSRWCPTLMSSIPTLVWFQLQLTIETS